MKVITNPNIICFDVDGTLIDWNIRPNEDRKMVAITTPWGSETVVELEHVTRRLKAQHMQGHYIIVWSQGGQEWGEFVIKALGLGDCVDLLLTKPKWAFDDLPIEDWLKRSIP